MSTKASISYDSNGITRGCNDRKPGGYHLYHEVIDDRVVLEVHEFGGSDITIGVPWSMMRDIHEWLSKCPDLWLDERVSREEKDNARYPQVRQGQ